MGEKILSAPSLPRHPRYGRLRGDHALAFAEARNDIGTAPWLPLGFNDIEVGGVLQEVREALVAVVALIERRLLALHRVFDHGGVQELVILSPKSRACIKEQGEGLAFLLRKGSIERGDDLLLVDLALKIFVEDELVAVIGEQVRCGAAHTDADDVLAVLLKFRDERREIAVTGDDGECIDVRLAPREVHRIHDHADIRGVLASHLTDRNFNEFDSRLVERLGVGRKSAPVCVCLLDDQFPFLEETFEDFFNMELPLLLMLESENEIL